MLQRDDDFTLFKVIIDVFIICLIVGLVAVIKGNFWYSDGSVFMDLKARHPGVTEITTTERNVWTYSVITVKENGKVRSYYLDTNIFRIPKYSEHL